MRAWSWAFFKQTRTSDSYSGKRLHSGTKKLKKCDHSESNSRDQKQQLIEKLALTTRLKKLTIMSPWASLSPSPPDRIFIIIIYFCPQTSVSGHKNGPSKYVMGDSLCYADITIGGYLRWARLVLSREKWEDILSWHGGRWANLMSDLDKYDIVL